MKWSVSPVSGDGVENGTVVPTTAGNARVPTPKSTETTRLQGCDEHRLGPGVEAS